MKILAVILAIAVLAKIVIIIITPGRYLKLTEKLLKNYQQQAMLIYSMLTIVVGLFVFAKLNIVDVAGVMLFTSLLIGIGLIPYTNAILTLRDEVLAQGLGKAWLSLLLWLGIALWVLYAVFWG
ncbi:MAG: hypothetical protein FJ126_01600 [Deltaproteobacteria bacterium]|nr:hypothetical protein [Deltaproteobacteria bacterium]